MVPGRSWAQEKSGPWFLLVREGQPRIQEENLLLEGGQGRGKPHPDLCLPGSVYSASRLRVRKHRAACPAQLAAGHWAAPAGDTALRAEAAPGDTRGLKTLPPGAQQVTACISLKRGWRVCCLW